MATDYERIISEAIEDCSTIQEAVNEVKIVSPRYGADFKSLPMIAEEFQISSDAAEAAAQSAQISASAAADSANNAGSSANIAEAAATAATISAGVFETPAAGVDPVTGVADGAYFNVRSSSDDSYIDEYQNLGGVATPTGKSYPSSGFVNSLKIHNNLNGRDVAGAHPASAILDESGVSQQEINRKVIDTVTLQSFMTAEQQEDCKLTTPLLDHSDAIADFFNFITANKVLDARFEGNLNLSQPVALVNPLTDAIHFDATINAKGAGDTLITFTTCKHITVTGKLMLTTGSTVYSGKVWNNGLVTNDSSGMQANWYLRAFGFKHWNIDVSNTGNSNSISLGAVRSQYGGSGGSQRSLAVTQVNTTVSTFTYGISLDNENYRNLAFVGVDNVLYPVISHDVSTKTIVTALIPTINTSVGIFGSHLTRNFTARNDNPTSASPSQRSIITLDEAVDLPSQFERSDCVFIDDEVYRIYGYNPATLELSIYPLIKDYTKTSGLVHFSIGGGVRINGSDSNLVSFKKFTATGNATGISSNNFYCTSVASAGLEYNNVGLVVGVAITGVTKNNDYSNCYFEANVCNVLDVASESGINVITNPIAWDWSKFKRLVPLDVSGNLAVAYSKTGLVVVEDGVTYRKQVGNYAGGNSTTNTLYLGNQGISTVRGSTNTIILADHKKKRELFGYTDVFFNVVSIRNNGTSDGASLTISSADGYTINGQAGSYVIQGARNALLVHAKLIGGTNWQVSVFKASYMPVVKTLTIPSIAANAGYTTTTTLANAQVGDLVKVAANIDLQGMLLTANVSASGLIRISLYNPTAAAIDLGSVNFECSLER